MIKRKKRLCQCLCLIFLILAPLSAEGDELTQDPPFIWDSSCFSCIPCESFPCIENDDRVIVDLLNPIYEDGVLSTDQGGVISAGSLRVQARKVVYTRQLESDTPCSTICCEGDLLVDYHDQALTGDFLFYDFLTQTGYVTNGKTASPPWYIGGDLFSLQENGDLIISGGYLTTSEGEKRDVQILSSKITLTRNRIVTANNVTLRVNDIPLFWLPHFQLSLKHIDRPPIAVRFGWGGYLGSHLSVLYRFLNWNDFKATARVDAFFGQGVGGGIETAYNPRGRCTEWYSRNYYANDIAIDDPIRRDRYRFEGTFFDRLSNDSLTINGVYDFVSDAQMAADYRTKDFDLKTAGRTEVSIRKENPDWIANFSTRVRVNSFQTVNQELPFFELHWHPFEIPGTGIMAENIFNAGYLKYDLSDKVINDFNAHSGRIGVLPRLYRPTPIGPVTVTPEVGFIGIYYTDSPGGKTAGQALGDFALKVETSLSKGFNSWKHTVEPYIHTHFLTSPRVPVDNYFVFSIDDGWDRLELTRFGVQSSIFVKGACGIERLLWLDLWANAFYDTPTIPTLIPKGYWNLEWQPYSRLLLVANGAWNFERRLLDFSNTRLEWTLSENLAFGLEYRHRSRFDWRKADFYNFILESARSQEDLLFSPVSEKYDSVLLRTFWRPNPDYFAKLDLRYGWHLRTGLGPQPKSRYFEYQIEAGTVLFQHWRLTFIYEDRTEDHRFSFSLKLDPGPPSKRTSCCR